MASRRECDSVAILVSASSADADGAPPSPFLCCSHRRHIVLCFFVLLVPIAPLTREVRV